MLKPATIMDTKMENTQPGSVIVTCFSILIPLGMLFLWALKSSRANKEKKRTKKKKTMINMTDVMIKDVNQQAAVNEDEISEPESLRPKEGEPPASAHHKKGNHKKGAKQIAKTAEKTVGNPEEKREKPVRKSSSNKQDTQPEATHHQEALEVIQPKNPKTKVKATDTTKAVDATKTVDPVKVVESMKAVDVTQAVEASMAMAATKIAEATEANAKNSKDKGDLKCAQDSEATVSEAMEATKKAGPSTKKAALSSEPAITGGVPMSPVLGVNSPDVVSCEAGQNNKVELREGPDSIISQKEKLKVKNQKLKRKDESAQDVSTDDVKNQKPKGDHQTNPTPNEARVSDSLCKGLAACEAVIEADFAQVLPSKESKALRKAAAVEKQQREEKERVEEEKKARACAQEKAEERKRFDELEQERRLKQLEEDKKQALKQQAASKLASERISKRKIVQEPTLAGHGPPLEECKSKQPAHVLSSRVKPEKSEEVKVNIEKKRRKQWSAMLQEFAWENFENMNYIPTSMQYPGEQPRDGTADFKNQLDSLGLAGSVAIHSTLDGQCNFSEYMEFPFMPADMQMHVVCHDLPTIPNDLMMQPMPEYLLLQPQDYIQDPLPSFNSEFVEESKGPFVPLQPKEDFTLPENAQHPMPTSTEFVSETVENLMPSPPEMASMANSPDGKRICWDMKMLGACSRGDACPWSHSDCEDDKPAVDSDWVLKPPFTGKIPLVVPSKKVDKDPVLGEAHGEENWVFKSPIAEKTNPWKAKTALTLSSVPFIPAEVFEELENQLVGLGFA